MLNNKKKLMIQIKTFLNKNQNKLFHIIFIKKMKLNKLINNNKLFIFKNLILNKIDKENYYTQYFKNNSLIL